MDNEFKGVIKEEAMVTKGNHTERVVGRFNPQLRALLVPLKRLRPDPENVNSHPYRNLEALRASFEEYGQQKPVVAKRDGTIIAGNGMLAAARALGWSHLAAIRFNSTQKLKARGFAIADNRSSELSEWDVEGLSEQLRELLAAGAPLEALGWAEEELKGLLEAGDLGLPSGSSEGDEAPEARTLVERFGVPPFSVLDARQGYWRERKRAWLSLGIQSELGRGENALDFLDTALAAGGKKTLGAIPSTEQQILKHKGTYARAKKAQCFGQDLCGLTCSGTSVFDPVLCEIVYRWFCPPQGRVLDPFAGGSVRGIVAGRLGRKYVGVDLSGEQLAANRAQGKALVCEPQRQEAELGDMAVFMPRWVQGDSRLVVPRIKGRFDLVFSCPPYADLEIYSDDPADLSTMEYGAFLEAYREIIATSCARLAENRFACFVVGDIRDRRGDYRNFVSATIKAFLDAGLTLYNEAILVTATGSLPIRAGILFQARRKLGKAHQNVLVFLKGDARKAVAAVGPVECGEISVVEALEEEAPGPKEEDSDVRSN